MGAGESGPSEKITLDNLTATGTIVSGSGSDKRWDEMTKRPLTLTIDTAPKCQIYIGDCRSIMPHLREQRFDCIFADPPFNLREPYSQWKNSLSATDYRTMTKEWLSECVRLLSPTGSFWVNCPNEIAARIVVHLEDKHKLILADWCIWHYRFGQWTGKGFIRSHTNALHFVKSRKLAIWNPTDVLVQSDRATKYNDARTKTTRQPGKCVPLDVWGVESDGPYWGRVQGNNAERRPLHPKQLPEKYIERAIRASTRPDSVVFTPFVGSGTELTVARALGLRSVGIEIGEREARSALDRIKNGAVRIKER